MGRSFTEATVHEFSDRFVLTRQRDPDDEFACDQVLTTHGWHDDDSLEAFDAFKWSLRSDADRALEVYQAGFNAAREHAYVGFA